MALAPSCIVALMPHTEPMFMPIRGWWRHFKTLTPFSFLRGAPSGMAQRTGVHRPPAVARVQGGVRMTHGGSRGR